jgi:hypothetical protein
MHDTVREETPKEVAYRLNKPSLRPADYTREIGSIICDRLFDGETLFEICCDTAMPDKPTVMRWLAQYPEFLDEYVLTGQLLAEALAADAVSMADNADTESRKRIRGAKIRRLCLALRHWVADRLIRKIVPQSEPC